MTAILQTKIRLTTEDDIIWNRRESPPKSKRTRKYECWEYEQNIVIEGQTIPLSHVLRS